jgi:hypothetical protein
MSNQHIFQFLDYYCDNEKLKNPQYAVLLKGKWGSGKTHFINKYRDKLKENKQRYIYVSLYGVTSYDEIETKFLQSSNPEIFNEKSILVGKLADAFINENIKKSLGQIKKSLSSLNAKGNILIFDDLERCSINIVDLLGYINNFVEHQSYKVILIANEEELEKTDKYTLIKEKLVGKTLEITSNKQEAYDDFLKEFKNKKNVIDKIFKEYKYIILNIYEDSQYNNLRVLRQSILDFERIYNEFLHDYDNKELLLDFIRIFFIFYFEIRCSNYTINDYLIDKKNNDSNVLKNSAEDLSKKKCDDFGKKSVSLNYEYFNKKYKISFHESKLILSVDSWTGILINSKIDKEECKKEIKLSEYFIDENTPNWKKLAKYYYKLDDREFEKLVNEIYNDFLDKYCENFSQYILISSLLLLFNENKMFKFEDNKPRDKILEGLDLVYTKNQDEIKKNVFNELNYMERNYPSYENIEYSSDTSSFKELKKYIDTFFEEKKVDIMIKDSTQIIDALSNNDGQKLNEILKGINDIRYISYHNKPILNYIDFDDFYEALINTDGDTMYYFGEIIKNRYYKGKEFLFKEKEFLEKLLSKVNEYIEKNEYKLSTYNLEKEVKSNITISLEKIGNLEKSIQE